MTHEELVKHCAETVSRVYDQEAGDDPDIVRAILADVAAVVAEMPTDSLPDHLLKKKILKVLLG